MSIIPLLSVLLVQSAPRHATIDNPPPVQIALSPKQKALNIISDTNDLCERALKALRIGQAQQAQVHIDSVVENLFWLKDHAPVPSDPKSQKAAFKELKSLQKEISAIDTLIGKNSKRSNDRMSLFQYKLAKFASAMK